MTRRLCAATLLSLALLAAPWSSAPALEPENRHGGAGQVIAELLSQYHFRDREIDDALSSEVYRAYFEALDPQRFYFLESDVEAFAKYREQLDDKLLQGEVSVAYRIFDRYQQRVEERTRHALDVIESGLDFETDATLNLDRSDADWAQSEAELDRLWEKRVINDALTQVLGGRELDAVRDSLRDRYERLARNVEQYNAEDVFQTFMNAWAGRFDPHTSYMSPRSSENFDINMRLSLEGIGALLRAEGDFVEVVELIPGGPAARSGELKAGDRIVGVGQEGEPMQDVVGWRLADVVDLIRGPKASEVRLEILPAAGGADATPEEIQLTRNTVELEEQAAQAEVIAVEQGDTTRRIGVIEIPAFYADFEAASAGQEDYRSTTRDVRALLEEERFDGIDGLVIDLRGNAGGSLSEAVKLSGLFIEQGPVVQVHRSNGQREVLRDEEAEAPVFGGPLGVLVDNRSASASEIFAAAMQDYERGVVLGDRTFGKGTVQSLIGLDRFGIGEEDNSGRLKLTIAKFYRINGESTQLQGVSPDLPLPSPHADDAVGERAADNALPWDTVRAARYTPLTSLDAVLPELRARHEARVRERPALRSVAAEAERLREEREDSVVSLNLEQRRAEIEAADARRLEAINLRLEAYGREPVESLDAVEEDAIPDVLREEAARVVADLAQLQSLDQQIAQHRGAD
ncbi:carboxy terminal-processing peptidase [Spiribacter halobius]|uniref:Peptidase S41 n=1 Tax=Sediminicurvatus halobius TaxID=2182432 RepID=A0A2U2N3Z5_9GAMM|nr:carboxy terminal-processing peptidase [Spiribacter halobius]PWG63941.1 peptidase S41 [Spiribacter halobius]UEX76356.1 carboxy terminal-processing peptidase [Spiribacter halobius]